MTAAILETPRLLIRNWRDDDAAMFHRLNSDETVMEFFPFRRNFAEAEKLRIKLVAEISRLSFGFTAAQRKVDGVCVGFCGLVPPRLGRPFDENDIEIGWRLLPEYWGQGYATEAARAWLHFGFEAMALARIVSFAVADNLRSIAVMRRIGMRRAADLDFDHPGVPDSHQHLKRHVTYVVTRADWLASL